MNVLVSSAARKVWLVRAFQAALQSTGGGRVIATDVAAHAAALHLADAGRLVPRSDDPEFIPRMVELCRQEDVGLLVPTRDAELPRFAAARETFAAAGVLVLVSDPVAVDACQDKLMFAQRCGEAGLTTPRPVDDPDTCELPVFVKPRRGAAGCRARLVHGRDQLREALASLDGQAIVQEAIEAPEYTIDVFADLGGRVISVVPRQRVLVVAGESWIGRTVRDPVLRDAAAAVTEALGLVGHVTVQAFRRDDEVLLIEVNPRYGGGAALGFAAGAPTPEFAVRLARGERLGSLVGYDDDLAMLRFTDDVFLPGGMLEPGAATTGAMR